MNTRDVKRLLRQDADRFRRVVAEIDQEALLERILARCGVNPPDQAVEEPGTDDPSDRP